MEPPLLVAHLGGVPEIASIVVPAVLFVLLLRAGRRRQDAAAEAEREAGAEAEVTDPESPDAPDGQVS